MKNGEDLPATNDEFTVVSGHNLGGNSKQRSLTQQEPPHSKTNLAVSIGEKKNTYPTLENMIEYVRNFLTHDCGTLFLSKNDMSPSSQVTLQLSPHMQFSIVKEHIKGKQHNTYNTHNLTIHELTISGIEKASRFVCYAFASSILKNEIERTMNTYTEFLPHYTITSKMEREEIIYTLHINEQWAVSYGLSIKTTSEHRSRSSRLLYSNSITEDAIRTAVSKHLIGVIKGIRAEKTASDFFDFLKDIQAIQEVVHADPQSDMFDDTDFFVTTFKNVTAPVQIKYTDGEPYASIENKKGQDVIYVYVNPNKGPLTLTTIFLPTYRDYLVSRATV